MCNQFEVCFVVSSSFIGGSSPCSGSFGAENTIGSSGSRASSAFSIASSVFRGGSSSIPEEPCNISSRKVGSFASITNFVESGRTFSYGFDSGSIESACLNIVTAFFASRDNGCLLSIAFHTHTLSFGLVSRSSRRSDSLLLNLSEFSSITSVAVGICRPLSK